MSRRDTEPEPSPWERFMSVPHEIQRRKTRVAGLSVASNTFLVVAKLAVGVSSGSVSILSEAIHSGIDLIAAIIALFAVRASGRPADPEHPFGHGKFENVSGTVEALLIFVAACLIIKEAVEKLVHGSDVGMVDLGLVVMGASALLNAFVARTLMRVARETDSVALEADALHLKTDVYTSIGVFIGLLLMRITNISAFDPLVAIGVALLILKEAWSLTRRSLGGLLDSALGPEEVEVIREVVAAHGPNVINCHDIRTRRCGPERHIDLHLTVAAHLSIAEGHNICDSIEEQVKARLPGAKTLIHIEPCDGECGECGEPCAVRAVNGSPA